ncbi:MAG: insulinase family protein, partial [Acidobacteriaceae bacterium]|nr:insulinase family protein [Acidobacteriaceae bacterium]
MPFSSFAARAFILAAFAVPLFAQNQNTAPEVTRATLDDGLQVVIVRDPLAPVVTLETNYLVGADETPAGFPGMAHAQEHMAFRGCTGLTADQIAAIYAQLGGYMNAETQQHITQYFVTVPAQDLDVALRVDAACMSDVDDSQQEWAQERGAIEQEVARDLSAPTYKAITRLNKDLFAGSPYAEDALGTKPSFDKTTGAMLKEFYRKWYAPNNAILIVTGDVDAQATLAKIKQYYGSIPRREIPARPAIDLKPVTPESFTIESNLPYTMAVLAFRFPGTDDPDYAAASVLGDVLASQRADLYALVPQGKALAAAFGVLETYRKASAALAYGALPSATDPASLISQIKAILAHYAANGVPADLVEAAKKAEVASAEFN